MKTAKNYSVICISFLNKGGLYKVYNGNLLYHGCVPLKEDGNLKSVRIFGRAYKGKGLYEVLESYVRKGFYAMDPKEKERGKRYHVVYLAE